MTSLEKNPRSGQRQGFALGPDQSSFRKVRAEVKPPTGGGSHFKIRYSDRQSLSIPVHNGKIKKSMLVLLQI